MSAHDGNTPPLQRLRLAVGAFPGKGFAVVDGGHFKDLPAAFRRARLFARSLFLEQGDPEIEKAGPWLVKLDQEPKASDKVFDIVGDKPAVVFWSCEAGEAVLHRHLRTINLVRIPAWVAAGQEAPPPLSAGEHYTPVFFRHFDPRVLGALLPCLDAAQFSRFLGPAEEVAFVSEDFGGLKRVIAEKGFLVPSAGLLTISLTQINGLNGRRLNASYRRTINFLRDVAPEHTRETSDDELLYQVQYSESVGRNLGIRSERAHAQWAFLMVTSKGHVAEDPTVTGFICAPGRIPDDQVDAALCHAVDAARQREGLGSEAIAPAGWAAGAGLLGGSLGEGAAGVGTFLVSNPVGWAILGTAAVAGVGYLGYKAYQAAHSQSQAKFQQQVITQVCSTCSNCNDLQKKSNSSRTRLTAATTLCSRINIISTKLAQRVSRGSHGSAPGEGISSNFKINNRASAICWMPQIRRIVQVRAMIFGNRQPKVRQQSQRDAKGSSNAAENQRHGTQVHSGCSGRSQ